MQIRMKRAALSSQYHPDQKNSAAKHPLWKISVSTTTCYSLFSGFALLITKKYTIAPTQ